MSVQTKLRKVFLSAPSNLTAAVNLSILGRRSDSAPSCSDRRFFSDSPTQNRVSKLPRVDSLVDGWDYKHWLVVMQPPDNYPEREEIVQQYVATLAMALGSWVEMKDELCDYWNYFDDGFDFREKAAKESIYSVSTKYYYAFSCKLDENLTHMIKCLPRVRWVLPDSYLCDEEGDYGGEPFIDGNVAPYDEKYHADWSRDACSGEEGMVRSRKPRRRRSRSSINAAND